MAFKLPDFWRRVSHGLIGVLLDAWEPSGGLPGRKSVFDDGYFVIILIVSLFGSVTSASFWTILRQAELGENK